MKLNTKQKKELKSMAHHLNPLVQLGKNGINEALIKETVRALNDHELIKIRIGVDDKEEFAELAEELRVQTNAQIVGLIGRIAIFYKPSSNLEKRKIKLSN